MKGLFTICFIIISLCFINIKADKAPCNNNTSGLLCNGANCFHNSDCWSFYCNTETLLCEDNPDGNKPSYFKVMMVFLAIFGTLLCIGITGVIVICCRKNKKN